MSIPERAMQIATSGKVRDLQEIRHQLAREGYSNADAHLSGAGFRKQLRDLIAASRSRPAPGDKSPPGS